MGAVLVLMTGNASALDKWNSIRSKNFLFVGDATEAQMRSVGTDLEQFREGFTQTFTATSKSATVPTTVVVFKNDESYRSFKPLVEGKPASVTGYFQPGEELNYLALTAGAPVPRAVYHQLVHELTRDMPSTIPLWFMEGMAEFYSTFEILSREKKFALGHMISEHMDQLRKSPLISLEELFAFDRTSTQYNERERRGIYYAESWALVNYLIVGLNGTRQAQIADFFNLLMNGKGVADGFQTGFKTDLKSMLSELDYYVRERADWPSRGSALKPDIDKDMKGRGLSPAEAEFYAGDLLMHMNRLIEAEPHLRQAITMDPKLASAHAAMGMLLLRQDKIQEALKSLQQATVLDPKNHLTHYYHAYVLDRSSSTVFDDLDAKRTSLGNAIELVPEYVPAYELLAYLNLSADIDYNGTLELLLKANKYAPGNQNVRFLIAQVLVKKQDFDQAERFIKVVLNGSTDLAMREGAQNLSNYIARVRAGEARERDASEERARREDEEVRAANRARAAAAPVTPAPVTEPVREVAPQPAPAPAPVSSNARIGELVAVTPQRARPQGSQVTGVLTLVDCKAGLTLTVKSATDTLRLHSDTPDKIEFVSYVPSVSTSISCGVVAGPGIPVVITYRPTPGGPVAGEPLLVEFVEKH